MNLIEAIASGRGWSRKAWENIRKGVWFLEIRDELNSYGSNPSVVAYPIDDEKRLVLDAEDILANDYILEPQPKCFTEEELFHAIWSALDKQPYINSFSLNLGSDARVVLADDISTELFKENK